MKKIILILLLFAGTNAFSQDSTNKYTGIITKKTFGPYRMDGKAISNKELKTEIYKVPAAMLLYKKATTSRIIGFSFALPMFVCAIANNQNKYIFRRDSTYGPRRGFLIVGALSGIVANYFLYHSISLNKKAIRARNSALKTIY